MPRRVPSTAWRSHVTRDEGLSEDYVAMRDILSRVAIGPIGSRDLDRSEAKEALRLVLEGEVSAVQAGAFLLAARLKRETSQENLGFLDALCSASTIEVAPAPEVVSLADPYNGFSRTPHFSAPTAAVLAACGLPAYVHGGVHIPPKEGLTARTVFAARGQDLGVGAGHAGVKAAAERLGVRGVSYVDVEDFCPGLHALTQIRRDIAKRPCLSLLEKLITPLRGQSGSHLVTGWVHKGYEDEIMLLARDLGLTSSTLIKGREGHIDPAVHRDTQVLGYDTSGKSVDLMLRPKSYGLLLSDIPDYGVLTAGKIAELWDEALHIKRRLLPGQTVRLLAGTILTVTGKASTVMRGVGMAHQAISSGKARDYLAAFTP